VDLVRGERLPTVQDVAQNVAGHWPDNDVRMIRHDDPRTQFVALVFKELNRLAKEICESTVAQVTRAMAGIEVFVHACRIPAEQFLLLVPRERTPGRLCLMSNSETQHD